MLTWKRWITVKFRTSKCLPFFAFCVDLFRNSNQNKRGGRVNWGSVRNPLMLWHKHKAAGPGLCFPADILLITADSRLENCWSWMPPSWVLFSHRCAEAKFPHCLLELEWKQIQFFPWGLANSTLCPSPSSSLPLLPIQLQYLAPVNSSALTNNAQEDALLALISQRSFTAEGHKPTQKKYIASM